MCKSAPTRASLSSLKKLYKFTCLQEYGTIIEKSILISLLDHYINFNPFPLNNAYLFFITQIAENGNNALQ